SNSVTSRPWRPSPTSSSTTWRTCPTRSAMSTANSSETSPRLPRTDPDGRTPMTTNETMPTNEHNPSLPSLFDLSGRTAVVVGAGSGLGQASAIGLADAGAHVIAAALNLSGANDTASLIAGRGTGSAEPAEVDITDTASVEALVTAWADAEVLVVTPGANVRKRLVSTSDEEFDRVIDLNLKGTYRLMRGFG